MADSFIGEGNRSTQRKPPTCRKSLTNLTLSHNVVSITPHHEFIHRSHIQCTYVLYSYCLLMVNFSTMKKWGRGGGGGGGNLVILYYLNATEI